MRYFLVIAAVLLNAHFVGALKYPAADTLSLYKITDSAAMPAIATKYEVVRKLSDGYEVIVPQKEENILKSLSATAQLITADISEEQNKNVFWDALSGTSYRNWEQVQTEMNSLVTQYPDWVQVIKYGESKQGRPLLVWKISESVQIDDNKKPKLMITAATHGDEVITTEVLMNLVHRLVDGSKNNDARMKNILASYQLYVVPVVNPDGFSNRQRYDNNADPNRSYPYPENPLASPTASIAALISLFSAHDFVGSLDYHAYGEMIMYPWAYTRDLILESDHNEFDHLAQDMASGNRYAYGPIAQVIYIAKGSSADYYYWRKRTKAFAIEMGSSKQPHPSKIAFYTEEQSEPLWKFIESF
jgi:hypothetical protein